MKIAIISDIHGNLEAFSSVLNDIDRFTPDAIVSLGDNIGYGADSEAVMALIISRNITTILGNHELACLDKRVYNWYVGDVKKSIDQTLSTLSKTSISYLAGLKKGLRKFNASFVHGFPPDSVRHYLTQVSNDELNQALRRQKDPLCFVGHTHQLMLVHAEQGVIQVARPDKESIHLLPGTTYMVNAGSVGQPRDGDPRAKYVIWDQADQRLLIRHVEFDAPKAARKILAAGLPLKFALAVYPQVNK